jgi:hypothetical protein
LGPAPVMESWVRITCPPGGRLVKRMSNPRFQYQLILPSVPNPKFASTIFARRGGGNALMHGSTGARIAGNLKLRQPLGKACHLVSRPKFVSLCGALRANFGFERTLATQWPLVSLWFRVSLHRLAASTKRTSEPRSSAQFTLLMRSSLGGFTGLFA